MFPNIGPVNANPVNVGSSGALQNTPPLVGVLTKPPAGMPLPDALQLIDHIVMLGDEWRVVGMYQQSEGDSFTAPQRFTVRVAYRKSGDTLVTSSAVYSRENFEQWRAVVERPAAPLPPFKYTYSALP